MSEEKRKHGFLEISGRLWRHDLDLIVEGFIALGIVGLKVDQDQLTDIVKYWFYCDLVNHVPLGNITPEYMLVVLRKGPPGEEIPSDDMMVGSSGKHFFKLQGVE